MPGSGWDALVDEHRRERVGLLWLAEVRRAALTIVARYPPDVYARSPSWDAPSIDDLVQDVVLTQLLAGGQVEYVVDVARDLQSARRLLTTHVRWTLARRRTRTVVDNVIERCRPLLSAPPYAVSAEGSGWAAGPAERRDPTHDEVVEAARRVARLPRVRILGGDRAPVVFTTDVLAQALADVAAALPGGFSEGDLDRIFSRVLTYHLPGALVLFEGTADEPDRAPTPEEALVVTRTVDDAYGALTAEQRLLLAMKLAERPDSVAADAIGISRPTAAKRTRKAFAVVREHVIDLPQRVQDLVVSLLAERLAADLPPTDGTAGHDR